MGETTTSVSKRSLNQKILSVIEVRGIVKVSKQVEDDPLRETYLTETVDISAQARDGRKLFQSFHVIAVPEDQFEVFERLQRQMRTSLLSELEGSFQGPSENGYPRKRIL